MMFFLEHIVCATENLVTPFDRAHRALLVTRIRSLGQIPRRIAADYLNPLLTSPTYLQLQLLLEF
jgi:hypothetical protein